MPVGFQLRQQALKLCEDNKFDDAVSCCRELYQLGLDARNTFVQGVACHYLGAVYFALGIRETDWNKSLEHFESSARLFHSCLNDRPEHSEGVVWFSIGDLLEAQCTEHYKDEWQECIGAFEKASILFEKVNDSFASRADDRRRKATQRWSDALVVEKHAQPLANQAPRAAIGSTQPRSTRSTNGQGVTAGVGRKPKPNTIVFPLLFAIFVFINLVFGILVFTLQQYAVAFLVGYGVAVLAFFSVVGIWSICYVPPGCVAVIDYRRQAWRIEEPGLHWLTPFLDRKAGSISTTPKPVKVFLHEFATLDGQVLAAHVEGHYSIQAPKKIWAIIGQSIQSLVDDDFRVGIDGLVAEAIDKEASRLLSETLVNIARDQFRYEMLIQEANRDRRFLEALGEPAQQSGLLFTRVSVASYVRPI